MSDIVAYNIASNDIARNVEAVYERITNAAQRAGRKAGDITLVAVTKTHPVETVTTAYDVGLRHFGENRVPEGVEKITDFTAWLSTKEAPQWHFIGHLQSRQVGLVLAGKFNLIHSVDSLKLAQRINRLAKRDNHPPIDVLLQCNVSGETTKSGFNLNQWTSNPQQLENFYREMTQLEGLNNIIVRGIMTMAPFSSNPEDARPTFQKLAALRDRLMVEMPQFDWQHLSMGMTDDFEVAIEERATIVRVGRAIFGERRY